MNVLINRRNNRRHAINREHPDRSMPRQFKIVIADRAAVAVNTIYNSASSYKGLYLFIATLLFTFQIYCDFSGYSDIAKGSARVLGFDLMDNFLNPYFSTSIKEFWRRWHISLSTWFMDYVYIPLGGNRKGNAKKYRNLFVTFLVRR